MPWAELIYRHKTLLFYLGSFAALVISMAGLFLDIPPIALVSFGIIAGLVILVDFRLIFFLLIAVLPLSNEVAITESLSVYLPTEPLTMLLMGIGVVYALIHPKVLNANFWKHPLTILVLIHLLWAGIASISSENPLVSIKYMAAKTWFIATYFFLAGYIIRNFETYKKVFWLLFLSTIGGVIYVLFRHASTGFLFDAVSSVVRPIYRNHVNYGVWITAIFPLILLARSWYRKDTLMRLGLNISLVINLVAIYFSYTRGAWVALLALPIFYFTMKYRAVKVGIAASLVGAVLFIGFIFNDNKYLDFAPDFNKTIYHEEFADHMTATFQMQDMSTVERFYRWIAAVKMFSERPVTGFGPGNFVNSYKTYTVSAYQTYISDNEEGSSVHNYFLTMLTEQGIPGLAIFLVLIIAVMLYFERVYHRMASREARNFIMAIACCFLVLLINNVFSDLLEADKLGPLFFLCIALLINWDLKSRPDQKDRAELT